MTRVAFTRAERDALEGALMRTGLRPGSGAADRLTRLLAKMDRAQRDHDRAVRADRRERSRRHKREREVAARLKKARAANLRTARQLKTFERDQAVEIQRTPGAPWEPATYRGRSRWHGAMIKSGSAWHNVELHASSPERWVESMTGIEWDPSDVAMLPAICETRGRLFRTRALSVPSRRIRVAK